ncbi:hypothetical protein NLX69_00275 [Rossellomorea sp. BNER]|nr:hypothetical protein [Rossellomorea sp. BNER]
MKEILYARFYQNNDHIFAWFWADGSRFRNFHTTMIYLSVIDLLYFSLTTNDPL